MKWEAGDDGTDPLLGEHPSSQVRLLPGSPYGGETSILITDSGKGPLSRIADEADSALLASGTEIATRAGILLADPSANEAEPRFALHRTVGALTDVLRIAESRCAGRLELGGQ